MATQSERFRSGSAFSFSDLVAQFRWLLVLLGASILLVAAGVVLDSMLGYPVFGGLVSAFGIVTSGLLVVMGLALLAYRIN